jgi:hypothetical protein
VPAPDEKVAAAGVRRIYTARRSTGRRFFPARFRLMPLGHSGVKPKLTSTIWAVKIANRRERVAAATSYVGTTAPGCAAEHHFACLQFPQKPGRASLHWTAEDSCP